MSPLDPNGPGVKGKKVPGRPSRFDPSEPLHMTTRRAAKSTTTNGSPSVNGSVDGDDSRRNSFDHSRPMTAHSNGSQVSVKSRRTSDVSMTDANLESHSNGLTSTDANAVTHHDTASDPLTPSRKTPSPTRKRKRSSPEMSEAARKMYEGIQEFHKFEDQERARLARYRSSLQAKKDENDSVEVVPEEDLSDREDESPDNSGSQQPNDENEPYDEQSMDFTPAASLQASPPSRESEFDEDPAVSKSLEESIEEEGARTEQEEAADPVEEMDVDVDAEADVEADAEVDVEGAEEGDEADEQLRSDDEERPARRVGGRRRAQHPIPKVERAMQRQAELKTAYRVMARAQKAVLAEIAQRTVDNLEADPNLYMNVVEYAKVMEGVGTALSKRQVRVNAQREWNLHQLGTTLKVHSDVAKAKCMQEVRDLKEARLARLDHRFLTLAREAQLSSADAGYETEDEDDVIPRPKRVGYRFKLPSEVLEEVYYSRSREVMETMRATDDLEARFEMHRLIDELDAEDKPTARDQFTVMNEMPRKAADATRKGFEDAAKYLAQAAEQVEKTQPKKIPVIPNKEARGLQLLGDLASRPSLTAMSTQRTRSKSNAGASQRRASTRLMQPQLHIQTTGYGQSPIQIDMSPRTTQALGERFDAAMLPPMTPRHPPPNSGPAPSPQLSRPEATLASPIFNIDRFSNSQPPPMRTQEKRPEPPRSYFQEHSRPPPQEPRPQSENRPNTQFSPPRSNDGMFPLWREYPREAPPPALHRRSSSSHSLNDRPFPFGIRPALGPDRFTKPDQGTHDAALAANRAREPPGRDYSGFGVRMGLDGNRPPSTEQRPDDSAERRRREPFNPREYGPEEYAFGMRRPSQADRPLNTERRAEETPKQPDASKDKPSPFAQLHSRSSLWKDRPSLSATAQIRFQDQRPSMGLPGPRPSFDAGSPPQSQSQSQPRNPPTTTFVRDFRNTGIETREDANRDKTKGPLGGFKAKAAKDERDPLARRSWSGQRPNKPLTKSIGGSGSAGSPVLAPAGSPVERTVLAPPPPWNASSNPQHSPTVPPPPPPASYQPSPFSQPPPQSISNFRPAAPSSDLFPNRSSLAPRPASSSFDRLPPTPLYGMSAQQQQQQQPPPTLPPIQQQQPGGQPNKPPLQTQQQQQQSQHGSAPTGPAEQFRHFPPPNTPSYGPPPPPPPPLPPQSQQQSQSTPQNPQSQSQPPQSPFPQSTAPTFTNQFGGPPLAPAGASAHHQPGFRPTPAFAQQALQSQQSGSGANNRRRTQSDAAQFAKFQPWNPPVNKR